MKDDAAEAGAPVRTCVGCRRRASRDSLVRVVWDPAARLVRLDPERQLPGRGASLHPDERCWDLAVRRRAVGRALRLTDIDGEQVRQLWVEWATARPEGRLG